MLEKTVRNMKLVLVILICIFSSVVQSEVYKWVDDKGVVHYDDKQPEGEGAIEVQVDMTSPEVKEEAKISRDEKRRRLADAMEEDRLEKKKSREKKKAERDLNKLRCNQLKDKMKRIKNAAGIYKLDKDGNRVILSDDQRRKNEKLLSNQIKKYCR